MAIDQVWDDMEADLLGLNSCIFPKAFCGGWFCTYGRLEVDFLYFADLSEDWK
jgi:hypothetical protein